MKFSVAMCVYEKDNPEFFNLAIKSVLQQTVKPDEVVLVVDGYVPDELNNIIEFYMQFDFFKVFRLNKNMGHGVARKYSLDKCQNDLVALMDADDISVHNRFEKQIFIFQNDKNISIVGGNICEFIGNVSNKIGIRKVPQEDKKIKEYMKYRCPFNQVTVMLKKSAVLDVGGYIDWYCEEDYYLWLRMFLANKKFANIDDVLVEVRVGTDMYKRRGGRKYFTSEAKLQKYMLENNIIDIKTFLLNITKRMIVQILLPNNLREWAFKNFARENVKSNF